MTACPSWSYRCARPYWSHVVFVFDCDRVQCKPHFQVLPTIFFLSRGTFSRFSFDWLILFSFFIDIFSRFFSISPWHVIQSVRRTRECLSRWLLLFRALLWERPHTLQVVCLRLSLSLSLFSISHLCPHYISPAILSASLVQPSESTSIIRVAHCCHVRVIA